ncbi:MAG: transposase [Clostridiales bacterium]|nr:transposase [Clostridiales bacterium]
MYFDFTVPVPPTEGIITFKKIKNTTYVNYEYDRIYDKTKKYTNVKRTTIGKLVADNDKTVMYPNKNFYKYYPDEEFPVLSSIQRSSCLKIGTFILIEKILKDYHLPGLISKHIGSRYPLFLDLLAYSIVCEDNAAQYYPDYAYNHPLFTEDMHIYSDSSVCDFLAGFTIDQSIGFLNEWNSTRDHREKIYISYDSTNKKSQAGDIEFVEMGHSKDGENDKPVFNYSVAYDSNNSEPLFYEDYCGSIVDISQLQYMLERARGYGYRKIGFILDRGYFSKGNIHYMDDCGYDFVIMMKGMKDLASEVILECIGKFEKTRKHRITEYDVSGFTVKRKLFPSDKKERYFHVYYGDWKAASEREALEKKLADLNRFLKKSMGGTITVTETIRKYFTLIYYHEGQPDEKFMHAMEKEEVIDREISLCGYFIIITSQNMTAKEALLLYKSRDASEKLFRGDKSYLGNKSLRVHKLESAQAKIFIEFVALIVRNRIYRCMKEYMIENDIRRNYLDVPAALKELDKIEMIRYSDDVYRLSHAITKTQKTILAAFGMTEANIKDRAKQLSLQLEAIEQESKEDEKNNVDR